MTKLTLDEVFSIVRNRLGEKWESCIVPWDDDEGNPVAKTVVLTKGDKVIRVTISEG